MEQLFTIENSHLSPEAKKRKEALENDPSSRTNHMEYMDGMEILDSDIKDRVREHMRDYNYNAYTDADVVSALAHARNGRVDIEDFKALLSPAALPHLEEMAELARKERRAHFGDCVNLFTPLYIANYCENYCVYCGFNCYNHIHRKKLTMEEIAAEMQVIADSGIEEILMLTGESRAMSDVNYIGEACKLARRYFRNIGLEIYPVNTEEYRYLHECGADYITVFQETYNPDKYETLHLLGHKRVWPYRFDAQERALRGGMRGVGFSALLGLDDYHTDALATALHVYYLQRKYPHAEMSISCPRLRPIINNEKINPRDVHEDILCQILCAYRLFLPFAAITVSSREDARFRDGIIRIAATKISAGVSTGIGDHKEKYEKHEKSENKTTQGNEDATGLDVAGDSGDEQFEIADNRSFDEIYAAIRAQGMQPVLNEYFYV
ncbi:MAG: 2-iminoacetate synthase ThiH [Wujia sp.]